MKKAPGKRVAGKATAVGAVMFFGFVAGCQPGTLPCEKPEWKEICALDGGSGPVTGMGGSNPGTGGTMPAGTGGSGPTPGDVGERMIMNCSAYPKVKDMDTFFNMRCGGAEMTCHATEIFGTAYKDPKVYERIVTKASVACPDLMLASKSDHTQGSIWAKTLDMPTCQGGKNMGKSAGTAMPSKKPNEAMVMPLTTDEKTCLENYLKALVEK